MIVKRADGAEQTYADVLWDCPVRSINCTSNGCFMGIGSASWQGSSFDGPWTRSKDTGIDYPEEFVRATNERLAGSVLEEECLGETQLDGKSAQLASHLISLGLRPDQPWTIAALDFTPNEQPEPKTNPARKQCSWNCFGL
jgi:hypothetical protein